ncbi:class I SAM-dependent methyltransferase [Serpens gallinarum]|uniref:Methyltransferase domain-containing protein n=1 Tax=Serpens gallinarum TaxID=2763075 RepID=A0ABR8TKP7_9PSED|nr:class I SAM-dependent methyltransferase [Serpens gallinarum]MBD7976174.1 methyltransferase domain-containing protein [Serpens gallinarum]
MNSSATTLKNWFEQGGQAYARFRPEYPPELAAYLASVAPDRRLAVDVGCGNGQLTKHLAAHFSTVVGLDPSGDQITHAVPQENVSYDSAPAEALPLPGRCASLITAAQAAHWFDLPKFYSEARRVAVPNAILALISYGVLCLGGPLGARFEQFYCHEIGPYWPAERKLVDSGYATLDFPFTELEGPSIAIHLEWCLEEFLGYVSTWSAVRSAKESGREEVLHRFATDLAELWGDRAIRHSITWPINMRIGQL